MGWVQGLTFQGVGKVRVEGLGFRIWDLCLHLGFGKLCYASMIWVPADCNLLVLNVGSIRTVGSEAVKLRLQVGGCVVEAWRRIG